MAYRNVFITSNATIKTKNEQLIINTDDEHIIPLEDINCVLLESLHSNISTYTLYKLAEGGICLFVCDETHLPCGILLPYNQHSRQLKLLKSQHELNKPYQKRIWQHIIKNKIANQACCIQLNNVGGYEEMMQYAKNVCSGDSTHMEASAAAYYFKKLFGRYFTRSNETIINAALNYGYAIFRGIIARTLCSYGFELCLGINHHSELNNFNLVDDVIEPYRPIIDLFVSLNIDKNETDMTPKIKQSLYNLLNVNVLSNGEVHSVSYAIERTVKSLSTCLQRGEGMPILCELIPLEQHEYGVVKKSAVWKHTSYKIPEYSWSVAERRFRYFRAGS